MANSDDHVRPLFHLDGLPVPANAADPTRRRLQVLHEHLLREQRWRDADVIGWLVDDLDRLPPPWGRVIALLAAGSPVRDDPT